MGTYCKKLPSLTCEQQDLLLKHRGMAVRIALDAYYGKGPFRQSQRASWRWGTEDDLIQECLVFFARAAVKYDASLGYTFGTFAYRSTVLNLMRQVCVGSLIRLPTTAFDSPAKMSSPDALRAKNVVFDSQICAVTGTPGLSGIYSKEGLVQDLFVHDDLEVAMKCLTPKERRIIRCIYFKNKTVPWISRKERISKARVYFLRDQALRKMRDRLEEYRYE